MSDLEFLRLLCDPTLTIEEARREAPETKPPPNPLTRGQDRQRNTPAGWGAAVWDADSEGSTSPAGAFSQWSY